MSAWQKQISFSWMSRQVSCTVRESHFSLNKTKTCENLSETPLLSLVQLYTELLNGSTTWMGVGSILSLLSLSHHAGCLGRAGQVLRMELRLCPCPASVHSFRRHLNFRSPTPFQSDYAGTPDR